MSKPPTPPQEPPQETANRVARAFFGVGDDETSQTQAIHQMLVGAALAIVLIPGLFYLGFGEVGPLGWGMTVFVAAYCLLAAVGLYFRNRPEYQTPVPLRGDWLDRVGAFWLVSCAFGPLLGWFITAVLPVTIMTWRWLYAARLFFAAGLPILTALPLTRYVRGKGAWIALLILMGVTLLAALSAVNVSRDLWAGPLSQVDHLTGQTVLFLRHTARSLGTAIQPASP